MFDKIGQRITVRDKVAVLIPNRMVIAEVTEVKEVSVSMMTIEEVGLPRKLSDHPKNVVVVTQQLDKTS